MPKLSIAVLKPLSIIEVVMPKISIKVLKNTVFQS